MFFAADFSPIRPEPGLMFWSLVFFVLFWWLMSKFAFKPLANLLKDRELEIQNALDEAKKAREEIAQMKAENDQLLAQAARERAAILDEAKKMRERIVKEAQDKAKQEADKIISAARQEIENQKLAAIAEVKTKVGDLAIEVAERVLRKQLASDAEQKALIQKIIENAKLN